MTGLDPLLATAVGKDRNPHVTARRATRTHAHEQRRVSPRNIWRLMSKTIPAVAWGGRRARHNYAGDSHNTCRCGRARSSAIQQNARIILLAANGRAVEPLRADLVELAQPFAWHGRYIHTTHVSVDVVPPSFAAVRVVLPAPVEDLEVWSSPGLRSARSFKPRCPRGCWC